MIKKIPSKAFHFIGWGFIGFLFFISDYLDPETPIKVGVAHTIKYVSAYGGMFYFHYTFLIPRFLNQRRIVPYTVWFLVSVLVLPPITYGQFLLIGTLFEEAPTGPLKLSIYLANLIPALAFAILGSAFRLGIDNWKNQRKAEVLAKEKSEAELNALKAQINPHFLFNAFNSLYHISRKRDSELAEAIRKLADLMRYIQDYSKEDATALENEVEMLENYLAIQNLRLPEQFDLKFDTSYESQATIIPLIFMPLVENCFKHGDLSKEGFIYLTLALNGNRLNFSTKNKVDQRKKQCSKTGLANLRERLFLVYGNGFSLSNYQEGDIYVSNLQIPLSYED